MLTVNKPEEAITLDLAKLCSPLHPATSNPIDYYYSHCQTLLAKAVQPVIRDDPVMLRLLVLEVISAAERYFRTVLAGILDICPVAASVTRRRTLSLAAVDYFPKEARGLGLIEHSALSGDGEVKKQTANLTGIEIKSGSSVASALGGFESICQLRHAIIHSRSEINPRNLVELDLFPQPRCEVKIDPLAFQAIVARCHNAVRAYNSFLAISVIDHWIAKKVLKGDWAQDGALFSKLHRLLYSTVDGTGEASAQIAYAAVAAVLP